MYIFHDSRSEGKTEPNTVMPFVIINFSHHEHLHLPKDHIVAFTERDCNDREVLEIFTMEQLERDLPHQNLTPYH